METMADRVRRVRETIAEAAVSCGRKPEEICLVAASKTMGAEAVREAILAGVDAVGENRCQELTEKLAQGAYTGAPLHFIGHLQQNKLKYLVGKADLIQSVENEELLRQIDRRAETLGIRQAVLLQVNIGREEQKGGADPDRLPELCTLAGSLPHVRLEGLMAVPPVFAGQENYPYFEEMYQLFIDIRAKKYNNVSMNILSMGMSGDYPAAIRAGANMVRVGTAIFGARTYPQTV